jgi:hypothetical protein
MSTWQLRLLAVACWLVAIALTIPFLALYETYSLYRDGDRVTATVEKLEPRRSTAIATLRYQVGGRDDSAWLRVGLNDPAYAVGAKVDLALHANNGHAILASKVEDEKPTWLLLAGAAPMIALGVWIWLAPRRARKRRAGWKDALDPIVDGITRSRNMMIGLVGFLVLAGPAIAIVPSFDEEATAGALWALRGLGAVSLALAVFLAFHAYKLRDPRKNHIVELLTQRPHEIAWFYVEEVRVRYGGKTRTVRLWKTDGKQVAISLVAEDMDAILAEIARRAPHAAQGFTPENQRLYEQAKQQAKQAPAA